MSIPRYYVEGLGCPDTGGDWVLYSDHAAEVERLTARVEELETACGAMLHGSSYNEAMDMIRAALAADKETT